MITTFFITIINGFLNYTVGLLPTGSLPAGVVSAFDYIVSALTVWNYLFPVDTLLTIVIIVTFINIFLFQYGLAMKILIMVAGRNRAPHQ